MFKEEGLQRRVSPAFASKHEAYQRAEAMAQQGAIAGVDRACNPPQRVREMDAFAELLRMHLGKMYEAGGRLAEMRGRAFGEHGALSGSGTEAAAPAASSIHTVRGLFEQLDAATDELLGHIARLEDLA